MDSIAYNVVALVLVAGVVAGIRLMSSPKTAVAGNLLGAVSMLGAILMTLVAQGLVERGVLWLCLGIGGGLGWLLAAKVAMIQMPQLIALFNGLGGGASALVPLVLFFDAEGPIGLETRLTGSLALVVGGVTLSGSLVAAAKLSQRIPQRPIVLKAHGALASLTLIALGVLVTLNTLVPAGALSTSAVAAFAVALVFGVVFAIRVGGADMPITISLLNALSGVAAAIAGLAIHNPLLVSVGAVVGAAGLILTRIMCRAMNRSLFEVLTGSTTLSDTFRGPGRDTTQEPTPEPERTEEPPDTDASITAILKEADKVVIVPGYGMALAQAQYQVKELLDELENQGKEVAFAIHPVAGRMPGHMNVLLAEVDVPYEKLCEMDAMNPRFKETDLALVIGANDVVNTAAATAEGTPIYGMPILHVNEAKHVIVCNLDDRPGYAGVENTLYGHKNVTLVCGDAKETVRGLLAKLSGT